MTKNRETHGRTVRVGKSGPDPIFFSILCNQLIKSFVRGKTDVISIAEN